MKGIAIAPLHNAPGRFDATGAFHPEAIAFAKQHGLPAPTYFDNTRPYNARMLQIETALVAAPGPLDVVAIFVHGWRDGLQTGHRMPQARRFAELLARVSAPTLCVALYACDAARDGDADRTDDDDSGPGGEGGFADLLRDELLRAGVSECRVLAHSTAGHTTRNPHLREFRADQATGGDWVVDPQSPLWPRWVASLREARVVRGKRREYTTAFARELPLLSRAQVAARLGGLGGAP